MRGVLPLVLLLSGCLLAGSSQTEKETALGNNLATEVRGRTTELDNPEAKTFAETVGHRLAAQMPDGPATWTFNVVQDSIGGPTNEPIALPGGIIFVPASLILTATSESEFAGMLAHAMAHVVEKHGIHTRSANQDSSALILSCWSGDPSALVPQSCVKPIREFELAADRFAVNAMSRAGYPPSALLTYLRRSAPDDTERLDQLAQQIEVPPANSAPPQSLEFSSLQTQIQQELAVQQETKPRIPSLLHPQK